MKRYERDTSHEISDCVRNSIGNFTLSEGLLLQPNDGVDIRFGGTRSRRGVDSFHYLQYVLEEIGLTIVAGEECDFQESGSVCHVVRRSCCGCRDCGDGVCL